MFNVIPVKILERFPVGIETLILKFVWEGKETRMAKPIPKKKN